MLNYKSILTELPFGSGIKDKVTFNFFKEYDIRETDYFNFNILYRRLISKDGTPFQEFKDKASNLYLIPFYAVNVFKTDHIIAMDNELNIYRIKDKDPQPFNFSKVDFSAKVYIAPDWLTFIDFIQSHQNTVLNYNECAIILDSFTDIKKWWVDILTPKDITLLKSLNADNYNTTKNLLDSNKLSYKVREDYVSNRPVAKDFFVERYEIPNLLNKKGIPATYDTIQKVTKLFNSKIPCKGSKYSYLFFEVYFESKHKNPKALRKDLVSQALKKYKELVNV